MSLNKKMFLIITVLFVLFGTIAGLFIYSTRKSAAEFQFIYEENSVPTKTIFALSAIVRDIPFRMFGFIGEQLPAGGNREALIRQGPELQRTWEQFQNQINLNHFPEDTKKAFTTLHESIITVEKVIPKILKGYEEDDINLVTEVFEEEWANLQIPLFGSIDTLIAFFVKQTQETYDEGVRETRIFNLLTIVLVLISLGVFIAVLMYMNRKIALPIIDLSEKLQKSSELVTNAATELNEIGITLNTSSNAQASSVEETSASLEEIFRSVEKNLETTKETEEMSTDVYSSSKNANSSMQNLISSMKNINASNENIQDLVKIIGEIADKTDIINEIVFQTKLLSFNASVEAERAGEHGRGFAVVAQEVSNLALMSGKAAREISEIVSKSVKEVEQVSHDNKKEVDEGNKLVSETASILTAITEKAEVLVRQAKDFTISSNDQLLGIKQITEAMNIIDAETQKHARMATETSQSSTFLDHQADELSQHIRDLTCIVEGTCVLTAHGQGVVQSDEKIDRTPS